MQSREVVSAAYKKYSYFFFFEEKLVFFVAKIKIECFPNRLILLDFTAEFSCLGLPLQLLTIQEHSRLMLKGRAKTMTSSPINIFLHF
jgi:hypothetical protein